VLLQLGLLEGARRLGELSNSSMQRAYRLRVDVISIGCVGLRTKCRWSLGSSSPDRAIPG